MFFATSGASFHIGTVRQNWTARPVLAEDFANEAWTNVHGLSGLGRIGGAWETDSHALRDPQNPDEPVFTTHEKTGRPTPEMELLVSQNATDAGQLRLIAAESGIYPCAFKLTFGAGSTRQFVAHVMSADEAFDDADSVVSWSFRLLLQSNILRN